MQANAGSCTWGGTQITPAGRQLYREGSGSPGGQLALHVCPGAKKTNGRAG